MEPPTTSLQPACGPSIVASFPMSRVHCSAGQNLIVVTAVTTTAMTRDCPSCLTKTNGARNGSGASGATGQGTWSPPLSEIGPVNTVCARPRLEANVVVMALGASGECESTTVAVAP